MVNQQIPAYIYGKKNSIRLILFTALFALVFINMFEPFSTRLWQGGKLSSELYLIFSSLIVLTGVLVVVISRIILFYRGRRHGISIGMYGVWIALEIFFMSLFYTVYTLCFPGTETPELLILIVQKVLLRTSLVLLLPYAVLHLYFAYKDKAKQLQLLQESLLAAAPKQNVYSFYDERGDLRLSVTRENLLYLEAADNYVIVCYLHKGALTKLLLRNSLKAIEKNMAHTNVVRCHRSYMVNLEAVTVIRRQKGDIFMTFGKEQAPDIPVSSKYDEKITRWFAYPAQLLPKESA